VWFLVRLKFCMPVCPAQNDCFPFIEYIFNHFFPGWEMPPTSPIQDKSAMLIALLDIWLLSMAPEHTLLGPVVLPQRRDG
jgi:hypothetical protein